MRGENPIRSVCVFCGSSHGRKKAYMDAAFALGRALAEEGLTLVFGGGNLGLMGELSRAALEAGGKVVGVIPKRLSERVGCLPGIEILVSEGMHERKARMHELSDAFIALPGGIGTLDEFFETLTWLQLGYHLKPVGIVNVEGFYDPLLGFLKKVVTEGFLKREHLESLIVDADPVSLLTKLRSAHPEYHPKLPELA